MEQEVLQTTQNIPATQPTNNTQNFLLLFVMVLLTAILVGGGVFFWQQSSNQQILEQLKNENAESARILQEMKGENAVLETKVEDLERVASVATAEKEEVEKKTCKGLWKNGICVTSACVDSDVNEKPDDIKIKGTVTYTDENGVATTVSDECTGSKLQVNEMWCYESPAGSGNYVQGKMIYDCPNGCLNGACIK
ncbi:hypothetical protein KBC89_02475 [Candidatus Woesebacteria bacterium]|nr:hypothetical protein [Candidatus Woesebacteria bacterium]